MQNRSPTIISVYLKYAIHLPHRLSVGGGGILANFW